MDGVPMKLSRRYEPLNFDEEDITLPDMKTVEEFIQDFTYEFNAELCSLEIAEKRSKEICEEAEKVRKRQLEEMERRKQQQDEDKKKKLDPQPSLQKGDEDSTSKQKQLPPSIPHQSSLPTPMPSVSVSTLPPVPVICGPHPMAGHPIHQLPQLSHPIDYRFPLPPGPVSISHTTPTPIPSSQTMPSISHHPLVNGQDSVTPRFPPGINNPLTNSFATQSTAYSTANSIESLPNGSTSRHSPTSVTTETPPQTSTPPPTCVVSSAANKPDVSTANLKKINTKEFEIVGSSPFDDALLRSIDDKQELNSVFESAYQTNRIPNNHVNNFNQGMYSSSAPTNSVNSSGHHHLNHQHIQHPHQPSSASSQTPSSLSFFINSHPKS